MIDGGESILRQVEALKAERDKALEKVGKLQHSESELLAMVDAYEFSANCMFSGNIKLPYIAPTENGVSVGWSYENAFASLEFDKSTGKVGWYCIDRVTKESMGSDEDVDSIPAAFFRFVMEKFRV